MHPRYSSDQTSSIINTQHMLISAMKHNLMF